VVADLDRSRAIFFAVDVGMGVGVVVGEEGSSELHVGHFHSPPHNVLMTNFSFRHVRTLKAATAGSKVEPWNISDGLISFTEDVARKYFLFLDDDVEEVLDEVEDDFIFDNLAAFEEDVEDKGDRFDLGSFDGFRSWMTSMRDFSDDTPCACAVVCG